MNRYECQNCKFEFEAEEAVRCPRCSSQKIILKKIIDKTLKPNIPQEGGAQEKKPFHYSSSQIYGDTKEAWKSFHSQDVKACRRCGGTDFEINFRVKEKVCKKCGEIMPFQRPR